LLVTLGPKGVAYTPLKEFVRHRKKKRKSVLWEGKGKVPGPAVVKKNSYDTGEGASREVKKEMSAT